MDPNAGTTKTDVTLEDIQDAQQRISGHAIVTPVMNFDILDNLVPFKLHFKCESFQKTGSFKFRGAMNAVSRMVERKGTSDDVSVITHSSGNFGQAVSLAAQMSKIKARIVMPSNAPICKVNGVKGYGATVISCFPSDAAREETTAEIVKETNATYISSSQTYDVIAGQGTMGLELLQQVSNLDAIVAPVGGGGMLAGICRAAKALKPSIKVYAAEPKNADDCARSIKANKLIRNERYPDTIADGLRVSIGKTTWPILRDELDDVILVTEEEICDNLQLIIEKTKLLIEPSAAVPVAAVRTPQFSHIAQQHNFRHVAVVLSGGNIDCHKMSSIFSNTNDS